MKSLCSHCFSNFQHPSPSHKEESKQEELECHFCKLRKISTLAETLYNGFPSCFPCKKQEKEINLSHIKQNYQMTHKHNKTSVEFGFLPKKSLSPEHSKEKSLEHKDLKVNISTIFEDKSTKKHNPSNSITLKCLKSNSPSRTEFSSALTKNKIPVDSLMKVKSGAFQGFDSELKKRGIKDLKIYEILSNIMMDGLSSLKSKMIYSSNRDKMQGAEFHRICDKQAPLMFLIFLNSGFMLGGYTYAPLDVNKSINKDKLAGIFSFFGDKLFFYEINGQEIKYEKNGFSFGVPYNIYIDLDIIDESYCNIELKYKSPLGAEVTFKISQNFVWSIMVKEIFVYKLS